MTHWTPAWVAAALRTCPLACSAEEMTRDGWHEASGLAARQPGRVLGDVARMPELIVVRCVLWGRAVGFDSFAGFLTPREACWVRKDAEDRPAGEGGDEI